MNNNTVKLENDVEIYENKISEYLDQYIVEKNIEDMSREPQSRWNEVVSRINETITQNVPQFAVDVTTGHLMYQGGRLDFSVSQQTGHLLWEVAI